VDWIYFFVSQECKNDHRAVQNSLIKSAKLRIFQIFPSYPDDLRLPELFPVFLMRTNPAVRHQWNAGLLKFLPKYFPINHDVVFPWHDCNIKDVRRISVHSSNKNHAVVYKLKSEKNFMSNECQKAFINATTNLFVLIHMQIIAKVRGVVRFRIQFSCGA
jgi:hypothetical protein